MPNRREFLAATGAIAATIPTFAESATPEKPARLYKAVKGGQKRGETPLDFFKRLKGLGFDGVESGNPKDAAAYFAATAETGIMVHGLVGGTHWKTRLSDPDAAVREKGRRNLEDALRRSWRLGGSSVLLVPGRVAGAKETHDDVWNRSAEQIKLALPLAAKLGVRILIETVWNGFCEDPETFRDYIDHFDDPWLGAYFDIGNMQKFAPAHEWIRILGSRSVKLDVKDWGKKNGFCRLGEGDVNWDKCREELVKLNFTGWATREGRDKDLEDTSALIDQLLLGK
jgi:hexulose-6-phosphate isomerase